MIFMTACWFLWTWRNKTKFEVDFKWPLDHVRVILNYSKDIEDSNYHHLHQIHHIKEIVYIHWMKCREGWIKLNKDNVCRRNHETSGCEGLFRNDDGWWIKGYTNKIDSCDALHAQMWGLYLSLDMARQDRISHLIVESDSKITVDMILDKCNMWWVRHL